ncbi:MAG: beta-ketoacyl-[acyl-carrier-protein] synthase II [Sphingobacteriales bacterium]|nr:MAG: beta-ketoacyl-[acyl-carrier-protein] synthase II [Sphingobacteriales bacterium]
MNRVVVTGIGTINPLGNTVAEYWEGLANGKSAAGPITKFDASKFKTHFACEVKGYDPLNYFAKGEARKYDICSQYALVSVAEALEQSGLLTADINKERVGVIWGSGLGGITTLEEQFEEYVNGDGTPRFNPYLIPKMLINIMAGLISIKYGFKGVNYVAVTACAAANSAMIDAFNNIKWGKADVIVTGGSEAGITKASMGGFGSMKALSHRNDDPKKASRPFDKHRDGFVMGEGAGAIILENYEHAVKRGATILAEIVGGGMTGDAYHISASHPEGEGAYRAMKLALEEAGITVSDIDYVNAHATSTPVGDHSEIMALKTLRGDSGATITVSATKSMTGHLLGAAGAIEAIATIKALQEDLIPPTINIEELSDEIPEGIEIVSNTAKRKEVNYAMSNTFGFGGHNAIVVMKKWK